MAYLFGGYTGNKKWIAKYCDLLEIKEIPIDETVSDLIETNKRFLTPIQLIIAMYGANL